MTKIYIKFGEPLPNEDHIYVYEAIVEDTIVRMLIPTLSYSTCTNVARDIELPAYVVEGRYIGKDNNGQHILRDYKVISKLGFDKDNENYIYKEKVVKYIKEIPKHIPLGIRNDTLTAQIGYGIGRLLGIMTVRK